MAADNEVTVFYLTNPFEGSYDSKSKELTLTHVELGSGRRVVIRLGSSNTHALYGLMLVLAKLHGGEIGDDSADGPSRH